ncbi:MAG: hypothetical protein M1839_002172 [Geoglossum umbratile]|nr:MAG: hypothetical protein M1839_002172 [Geoglossum umbratile]
MVIGSHLVLCFARSLVFPAAGPDVLPTFFQLPIIRLPSQGLPWVLLFVTLSSYAVALKPVKLSRSGKSGDALSSLASSCFRRTGRLFIPSVVATILSWFLCQVGAYEIGRSSDAWWISETSREPSHSWVTAFRDLINCIIDTWTIGQNSYDQPQWTLLVIFQASMLTYTLLLATAHAQSKHHLTGINVAAGVLLAELSQHPITQQVSSSRSLPGKLLPILLFITGLYFCSFPDHHPEWSPYFSPLLRFGLKHFPSSAFVHHFYNGLGAHLAALGIVFSSPLMRALSHPMFLFLGSISFPIYLLQGPTIRSVLSWVLYGLGSPVLQNEHLEGGTVISKYVRPAPGGLAVSVVLVFYFCFLFWVSRLWSMYLEPYFAWATQQMEAYVFGQQGHTLPNGQFASPKLGGIDKSNGYFLPK